MGMTFPAAGPANEAAALDLYRARCGYYDLQLAPYEALRRCAVERLALQPGQVVLDIGCGTGMSLDLLQQAVGSQGHVIAIDQSPEMLEQARQRVEQAGWSQVELICSPVQDAELPARADAALFHFTHDILQTPAALDHVLAHLAPGARLAACGLKWAPPWFAGLNPLVWWNAAQSVTTLDGLDAPWSGLAQRGARLTVEPLLCGTLYLASGQMP
jgi:SAM-dependent methyltransferase